MPRQFERKKRPSRRGKCSPQPRASAIAAALMAPSRRTRRGIRVAAVDDGRRSAAADRPVVHDQCHLVAERLLHALRRCRVRLARDVGRARRYRARATAPAHAALRDRAGEARVSDGRRRARRQVDVRRAARSTIVSPPGQKRLGELLRRTHRALATPSTCSTESTSSWMPFSADRCLAAMQSFEPSSVGSTANRRPSRSGFAITSPRRSAYGRQLDRVWLGGPR